MARRLADKTSDPVAGDVRLAGGGAGEPAGGVLAGGVLAGGGGAPQEDSGSGGAPSGGASFGGATSGGAGGAGRTVAPLRNVTLALAAMQHAINRPRHLPGMVTFSGPSGFGKSMAVIYVANRTRAFYVEARSSWTRKALLQAILGEMGARPGRTVTEMTDLVADGLARSGRPLIIDEMDHVVDRGLVEVVRDIYEGSHAPILLAGEELLPMKLKKWERFHGRILGWTQAAPVDMADARHLRTLYCQKVAICDDILSLIVDKAMGSARRVCVNLELVQNEALSDGISRADKTWWGNRTLYSGEPPARRFP